MNRKIKALFINPYFIITILTLLALFVRGLNIDKPYGLWYDEMLTYQYSSESFPFGIMKTLLQYDYHMPLYYFYVHIWIKLFGTSDIALRCSSVLCGTLTVPAFYYLGKEFRSKKLGYLLAIIGCFSPILIYYSQELRFYSMLVFFSTVSLIYFLKLTNVKNKEIYNRNFKKNLFILSAVNLVILYIYTMGIMFVGLEFLILIVHLHLHKRNNFKTLIKYLVSFFILAIPYLILFLNYAQASSRVLFNNFGWYLQPPYTGFLVINDLLSPCFMYLQGFLTQTVACDASLFAIMSTALCFWLIGLIVALAKFEKQIIYLSIIMFTILSVSVALSFSGNLVLSAKYVIIILPILLLLCLDGLISIRIKVIKYLCISTILFLYIHNTINYKTTPSFDIRASGERAPAEIFKQINTNKNDYALYIGGTDSFKKYNNNISYINLDYNRILYLDKNKDNALKIFNEDFVKSTNQHNSYKNFIQYFESTSPTPELTIYINSAVKKIPLHSKLIFVDDNFLKIYPNEIRNFLKFGMISPSDIDYYKRRLYPFFFSRFYEDLYNLLNNNKSLKKTSEFIFNTPVKKWQFTIYEKIK